jgi:hypothetical protein
MRVRKMHMQTVSTVHNCVANFMERKILYDQAKTDTCTAVTIIIDMAFYSN